MIVSSRIAVLIQAPILAFAIGCNDEPECVELTATPFVVQLLAFGLTAAEFDEMTAVLEANDKSWAEFDGEHRCEATCLFVGGELDRLFDGSEHPNSRSYEVLDCNLTLPADDSPIDGAVNCTLRIEVGPIC
jgi:hypothetical protein